ncbi:type II secretion system F family protein [Isoptericola sp. NPDC019482]|uniref:type II secretion system F family protein n=1 Tax=Isoptericola sp. NPDC019482 TaxID=3154688 RepID=UPI00347A0038
MSSGLIVSMLAGACIGLSIALLIGRLLPVHADLKGALDRLAPPRRGTDLPTSDVQAAGGTERVGHWAMAALPAEVWVRTPRRELALLNKPLSRFYGEKLTYAAVGLAAPAFLTALFTALGVRLPFTLSAVASLALAMVMFFLPDYNARDDAAKARVEFRRALGAYVELVALERTNGSGVRQAMEAAAGIGSSWVFTRIDEELSRSRLSGVPPWSALRTLGDDLGLPELHDFADIMRLSGEQGAAVYSNLRARADSMRSALLAEELAEANDTGERMSIPGSALGIVFMALLMAPALLRMFTST